MVRAKSAIALAAAVSLGMGIPLTCCGGDAASTKYQEALLLYWKEDNLTAFEKFVEVIEQEPDTVDARRATYLLSILLERKLQPDEYGKLRERLARNHPYLAAYIAGREAQRTGNDQAAFQAFVEFILASPSDAWRFFGLRALCTTKWQQGEASPDLQTLERLFEEVRRLNFRECPDQMMRAAEPLLRAYGRRQDYAAEASLRRLLYNWNPNHRMAVQLLECYIRGGSGMEAETLVEEMIARAPDDPSAYSALAHGYISTRNYDKAITLLERGFKAVGRKEPVLVVALATAYERQMKYAEALRVLQETGLPHSSQVASALERLNRNLPEKYMPEGLSSVSNVVNIAVGSDDFLYALVRGNPWKIVKLDKTGDASEEIVITADHRLQDGAHGFGIYPDGTFQVQNLHVDRQGSLVRKLDVPSHIFRLFVSSSNEVFGVAFQAGLFRAKANGELLLQGVDQGKLQPHAMGVIADDKRIIVADSTRLVLYDLAGNRLGTFGREGKNTGEFKSVYDLAMDQYGLIYVADTNNGRIQIFDRSLGYLTQIPVWPTFIAVDSQGAVYAEYGGRIAKYAPRNGGARALAEKKSQP